MAIGSQASSEPPVSSVVAPPAHRRVRPADLDALDELLYEGRDSYARPLDEARRVEWIAAAAAHHMEHNPLFARLAGKRGFAPDALRATGDLASVPLLSSGLFKRRDVRGACSGTVKECTSSGTQGTRSIVPRDRRTLERFIGTVLHGLHEFHGHTELRRALVLGPPAEEAGDLWFAYVLTLMELVYDTRFFMHDEHLESEELHAEIVGLQADEQPTLVGAPALLVDHLTWMCERGLRIALDPETAYVVTAGGWKRRGDESVSRPELAELVSDRLGLPPSRIRDVFNMVELNSVLFECETGAKHVPPWLAVIALRPADMSVADPGEEGILTFLDPTATSYPGFICSDDFGSVRAGGCACGRLGEILELTRRMTTVEERGCGLKLERYVRDTP